MKWIFLPLLVIGSLSSCVSDQYPTNAVDLTDDQVRLRQLKEVAWPTAYREQDTLLLDAILDDSFQMVDADGNWSDKAGELSWIKAHAMSHDSFRYEIKRLDVVENGTAIVAGTGHIINDGKESLYESTNVLVKKDGQWRAIASHVSGVRAANDE